MKNQRAKELAMNSFSAYCFIIVFILLIDICARSVVDKDKKPAGLIALILMCWLPSTYSNKPLAVKSFIFSLLLILFMLNATIFLLKNQIPTNASLIDFVLLLSPLFIMPFYHFLYALLSVKALTLSSILVDFRLRGALALLLSANIIFISLNPLNNLTSLIGHFALAFLAALGMFYLCSCIRQRPQFELREEALSPMILRYFLSTLEMFYYLSLLYFAFISGLSEEFAISSLCFFVFSFIFLLIFTFINKFHGKKITWLLSFYENKAVPLSFIFFGLMHLLDIYF
jgi:hypothetical protein